MTEPLRAPLTKANLKLLQGPRSESEESGSLRPMTLQEAKGSLYAYMITLRNFPPQGPEILKNDELYIAGLYDIRYRENGGPKQKPKPNLEDAEYWIAKCMYFREKYLELQDFKHEPSPSLWEWEASTLDQDQADQERIDEYILGWERRKAYIEEWVEAQRLGMFDLCLVHYGDGSDCVDNLSQELDFHRESSLTSRSSSDPTRPINQPQNTLSAVSPGVASDLRNRGMDAEGSRKTGTKRRRDHDGEVVDETAPTKRRRRSRTRHPMSTESSGLGKEDDNAPPQRLRRSARIAAQRSTFHTDFTSAPGVRRSARAKVYGVNTKPTANAKGPSSKKK